MLNSWAESHGLNKYRSITKDEEQSDGDGKCIFRQSSGHSQYDLKYSENLKEIIK